ncbi:MAG: phosphodiester glycosidase family protein [Planctomycetota bacterium]|jgi:hypothetical protein
MYRSQRFEVTHTPLVFRFICNFILALLITGTCFSQTNDDASALSVPPGLQYFHQQTERAPLSIHWVKIDRSRSKFVFTSSLAKRRIFDLEPLSLQIVRGELVSSPHNTCFWIDQKGEPHIARVQPAFRATWPDGTNIKFDINQECIEDNAVLYTSTMGPSTRTEKAVELILDKNDNSGWLPAKPGQTYNGRILSVNHSPNSVIPTDKVVLSLGTAVAKKIKNTEPGTVLSLSFETYPTLKGVDCAIGGGPVLIRNAKAQKFSGYQPRHPRTAIGFNDMYFFLLVVDGRQKDLSIGMTLEELADFMLNLGCTEAMNLDGGGSSTFWLDGKIMNSPSDGRERHIANGLILLQKQ